MATALASKNRTRVTGAANVPAEGRAATRAWRWFGHASFLLAMTGCGDRKQASAPPPAKVVPAPIVAARPVSAPHSARIALVATTDRGDAALTLDNQGALRLWPTLDGTYEPVVVRASAAKQLALARAGKELVAAILDDAGGVEVLRFDGAGGLYGRTKLPFEPRIDEVVIAGGHVIVKRADESLARYDTHGEPRGVLMPDAGQRVTSLDARRDRVIVGLGRSERATHVRFVTSTFAWGETFELPVPLAGIALSPGHTRVIGLASNDHANVIQLGATPSILFAYAAPREQVFLRKHGGPPPQPRPAIAGFLDDDHVVASGPDLKFASAAKPAWTIVERDAIGIDAHAAIGDVAVAGNDAGLVVSGIYGTQHLGYRKLGRQFDLAGAHVLAYGNREVFWLDDKLRETRVTKTSALFEQGSEPTVLFAIDDRHLIVSHTLERDWTSPQKIYLHDVTTKTSTEIATLPRSHNYPSYDRETGIIAFRVDKLVHRFRLDLAAKTATPLRPLADGDDLLPVTLTDPAKTNGVVALVAPSYRGFVRYYFDEPGTGPLRPHKLAVPKSSQVLVIDRAANVYVTTLDEVQVLRRDAIEPERFPIRGARIGAVAGDGQTLAFVIGNSVAVFERDGTQRWQTLVERPRELTIRGDVLFVDTDSGLLTYDLRTGARLSAVCGWGFGLYDEPDTSPAPNVPSACVDDR